MIMSDPGGNFISDKFRQFFKCMNINKLHHCFNHHDSSGQVEACIKFVKCTVKNALKVMMIYIQFCYR